MKWLNYYCGLYKPTPYKRGYNYALCYLSQYSEINKRLAADCLYARICYTLSVGQATAYEMGMCDGMRTYFKNMVIAEAARLVRLQLLTCHRETVV